MIRRRLCRHFGHRFGSPFIAGRIVIPDQKVISIVQHNCERCGECERWQVG